MKPLNIVLAVAGGALVGAAVGLLCPPDRGENTRKEIAKFLRKKGIVLKKNKLDQLAEELDEELEAKADE